MLDRTPARPAPGPGGSRFVALCAGWALALAVAGTGQAAPPATPPASPPTKGVDTSTTLEQTRIEQVAAGVYVLAHPWATDDWPEGNTTVVIGDSAVLVVDACFLPSTARADIAAIRKLTPKPVRYLVNTHWHYDHNQGNQVYAEQFPGIDIIAQAETRRLMDTNAASFPARMVAPGSVWSRDIVDRKGQLEKGLTAEGSPLRESDRPAMQRQLEVRERVLEEFRSFRYTPPTLTFDQALTLYLGSREVRILHLGRGNTPGDLVVHLPAEKVVVTGDLVVAPVPFTFNSYPTDWSRTLRALRGIDAEVIVPGHGDVQRSHDFIDGLIDLLDDVLAQTGKATARGLNLEDTRAAVELERHRRRFAGDDPKLNEWFRDAVTVPLVERAFREARGAQ